MEKNITRNKKPFLFTIDLDGTLLKDSATGEITKENQNAIKRLIAAGHVVCLVTGRPWASTQPAYEKLKLNTVVANYNGAYIHNPTDYSFSPYTMHMNLNDVMYILGDERIKFSMCNLAIEGPGWVMLEKHDKELEMVFGFNTAKRLRIGIDVHKLPLRPTGVVFDTKEGVNVTELRDYLQRSYGDLVEFSSWSKGEGKTPVFDMTALGVTKAKVVSLLSRYYNIPMHRTVAIGDGYNDVPMFEVAEYSVAMANATPDIHAKATYVTKKTNKQSGVAEFVDLFLAPDGKEFLKELSKIRMEKHHIKNNTVPTN